MELHEMVTMHASRPSSSRTNIRTLRYNNKTGKNPPGSDHHRRIVGSTTSLVTPALMVIIEYRVSAAGMKFNLKASRSVVKFISHNVSSFRVLTRLDIWYIFRIH
ncbi:hypothetical protein PoB_003765400 [Plakobranchus ocellatus]|uniref:Uncharacterized protein n=1 Tax=Plakobranchus ocellatus TaxID=259542 RepID=A0AAV4ATM3_9GAST|nr:hypothetical protein PoB_003765400 [Plakobranchus ocellatus]